MVDINAAGIRDEVGGARKGFVDGITDTATGVTIRTTEVRIINYQETFAMLIISNSLSFNVHSGTLQCAALVTDPDPSPGIVSSLAAVV